MWSNLWRTVRQSNIQIDEQTEKENNEGLKTMSNDIHYLQTVITGGPIKCLKKFSGFGFEYSKPLLEHVYHIYLSFY